MSGIIRGIVRYGVIGGICLGGVTLLVGPSRVAAVYDQVRFTVVKTIDDNIDDPILLRRQLAALEAQYPGRIAAVDADLMAVSEDIAQLEHDSGVSMRAVSLMEHDAAKITELIQLAEAKQASGVRFVAIRHDGQKMQLPAAYQSVAKLQASADFYAQRVTDNEMHLGYLTQQQERLEALLVKLTTEKAQFESQLWLLDNQIAAIDRNERLIDEMESREKKYKWAVSDRVESLDQLNAKLNELRHEQEQQLAALAERQESISYWDKARLQLESETDAETMILPEYIPLTGDETVIELDEESVSSDEPLVLSH
jgi:chromosome segregation ATPase